MREGAPPQIDGLAYVRQLGSGGFGEVYLYVNVGLNRQEAVKVISGPDVSGTVAQRFMAEANAMAGLDHPNIVPVYTTGVTGDGRPYLRMKFYPGGTMEQRAAGGRLALEEVLRTGISIGSALEIAHRAQLLHRDIKPSNILVDSLGSVGLTDFGVAAQMAGEHDDDDVGVSIPWSPPEMLYSSTRGTPQSDVYSLAATLWHLVVGRSPFEILGGDNSRHALMLRVRNTPAPVTGRGDIPRSLDSLLRQAMSKDFQQRPSTMAALVRALQQIELNEGLSPTPALLDHVSGPGQVLAAPAPSSPGDSRAPAPAMPLMPGSEAGTVVRSPQAGAAPPQLDRPFDHWAGAAKRPSTPGIPATSARLGSPAPAPLPTSGQPTLTGRGPAPSGLEPTEVRAPRVHEVAIDHGADPVPKGRVKGLLIGAGIVLLLVCGGLAYALLARDGSADPTPIAQATVSDAPAAEEEAPPPGPVQVTASRTDSAVDFSWTYKNALTTDTYRLRVGDSGETTSREPTLSVGLPEQGKVCVSVIVVRADGTNPTRDFPSPTCG